MDDGFFISKITETGEKTSNSQLIITIHAVFLYNLLKICFLCSEKQTLCHE